MNPPFKGWSGISRSAGRAWACSPPRADNLSLATRWRRTMAASLSNLWDGDPVRRLRAADGSMFLPGRRLAMHLAVQPEIADIMLADPDLKAQGLLSRILMTYPDSLMGTRMQRPGAKET